MPTPLKYPHQIQTTEPEVFIIESLYVEDEIKNRFEGRALRDSLRITGQHPAYFYARNAAELNDALESFRHSGYRFLHLSLHGKPDSIFTTLEEIPNNEFANMCAGKLKNRRVFFSACEVGSGGLPHLLPAQNNKGMYSIAAPQDKIPFGVACAFWTAFYTKVLTDNPLGMEVAQLKGVLRKLCTFFQVRLTWSYYVPATDTWNHMTIS